MQDATEIMQIRCKSRLVVTLIRVTILEVIGRQTLCVSRCLSVTFFLRRAGCKILRLLEQSGNSSWRRSRGPAALRNDVSRYAHIYEADETGSTRGDFSLILNPRRNDWYHPFVRSAL